MSKKYRIGMYGGKFIPFHKGHDYCLRTACNECDRVYCIMFINGADEERIWLDSNSALERYLLFNTSVHRYSNAIPVILDVRKCRKEDGSEDWDAETPLIREIVGDRLDAVYSSEPSYDDYFKRAYPEAIHVIVDSERVTYPISGTMIRDMKKKGDEKWKMYVVGRTLKNPSKQ